jgi:hypothetical protein
MWNINEKEMQQYDTVEPCTMESMSQTTMLNIINAEASASRRAMEILSLQADETEARLASESLTSEQFEVLIEERKAIRQVACDQANHSMLKSWKFWLCALMLLSTGVAIGRKA